MAVVLMVFVIGRRPECMYYLARPGVDELARP